MLSEVCLASDGKGREGSGLSTPPGDFGDIGVGTSDDVVVVVVPNDNVGSSNDTICGPFAFTSLP